MSDNLPAKLPVRQTKQVTRQSKATAAPANPPAALTKVVQVQPSPPGILLVRRHLGQFIRFASRLTARSATPALRCCLFGLDSVVVTDLDVALRGALPGARDIGVLVPIEALKRCLAGTDRPEISIIQEQPSPTRPFAVRVDGALLRGHDPAEFPRVTALFPDGDPLARARFQTLEPVLVAASTDEARKAMCGVFFQLCKNAVVTTNGHVLHAIKIDSSDRGDFLVPRKAIELVEIIRKATKTPEVAVAFHENHAVFRVATFDVSARLETAKFPAWEEIVPKKSKHELRVSKTDLLEALDRVAAAIGDRSRGVVLHRTGERLEIHGENPNAGELKTEIAASGWADKAVIEVNLGYLHNAARFAPSDELRIGLTDDASPLKIHEGPYLAVVMPIGPAKGTKS
jgi:DNA polymerase III beta subunit, C-terminal domain/DNA polymerase III beta subunit, central domain